MVGPKRKSNPGIFSCHECGKHKVDRAPVASLEVYCSKCKKVTTFIREPDTPRDPRCVVKLHTT